MCRRDITEYSVCGHISVQWTCNASVGGVPSPRCIEETVTTRVRGRCDNCVANEKKNGKTEEGGGAKRGGGNRSKRDDMGKSKNGGGNVKN